MLRRRGVSHVEDAHPLIPVEARIGIADEPIGVVHREGAARADQKRSAPDSGLHRGRPDPVRDAPKGTEPGRRVQPITDVGLVAVVDLDDRDRHRPAQCRLHVLDNIVFCYAAGVTGPGAPARRNRSHLRHTQTPTDGGHARAGPSRGARTRIPSAWITPSGTGLPGRKLVVGERSSSAGRELSPTRWMRTGLHDCQPSA